MALNQGDSTPGNVGGLEASRARPYPSTPRAGSGARHAANVPPLLEKRHSAPRAAQAWDVTARDERASRLGCLKRLLRTRIQASAGARSAPASLLHRERCGGPRRSDIWCALDTGRSQVQRRAHAPATRTRQSPSTGPSRSSASPRATNSARFSPRLRRRRDHDDQTNHRRGTGRETLALASSESRVERA
jgi:hypothetical protein